VLDHVHEQELMIHRRDRRIDGGRDCHDPAYENAKLPTRNCGRAGRSKAKPAAKVEQCHDSQSECGGEWNRPELKGYMGFGHG